MKSIAVSFIRQQPRTDRHEELALTTVAIPDTTWCVLGESLPPDDLGVPAVVDVHFEIIAERELEAFAVDVIEPGNIARQLHYRRPGCPAVGRAPVVSIP